MNIIDGKAVSKKVKEDVKAECEQLKAKGVTPGLAVIIVGDDPASQVYVHNKEVACEACGFYSVKYALPAETTQEELNALIDKLNKDDKINGILCQLPLPSHLDDKEVINRIDPLKDVDAFHPVNVGAIMIGDYNYLPCTPAGVMELIHSTGVDVSGKKLLLWAVQISWASLWQCFFFTKTQLSKSLIQELKIWQILPKKPIFLLPLSARQNLSRQIWLRMVQLLLMSV